MDRPKQPEPEVTERDVERVVRRDFAADAVPAVLALIAAADLREKTRVVLACLKLAAGEVEQLELQLDAALVDFRDPIAWAEYPLAMKRWSEIGSLSDDEIQAIYDDDARQYAAWLAR